MVTIVFSLLAFVAGFLLGESAATRALGFYSERLGWTLSLRWVLCILGIRRR